jgi:hypothetical protein
MTHINPALPRRRRRIAHEHRVTSHTGLLAGLPAERGVVRRRRIDGNGMRRAGARARFARAAPFTRATFAM